MYLDKNLDWIVHIDYVYKKILKYVGIFYKLQNKIPRACLRNIYFAFVYPHLFYGVELYANTYYSNLDKLVKLNNKLLRILQGKIINYCVRGGHKPARWPWPTSPMPYTC